MDKAMFKDCEAARAAGFEGFISFAELAKDKGVIPKVKGVYMVFRTAESAPAFLERGTGGHFKDDDPNVSLQELSANWVDGASVLYIGQTGATLQKRIGQYISFGQGKKVGHWGGRYIWQLQDAQELVVCWLPMPSDDVEPKAFETQLINSFREVYGTRPFANLAK